MQIWHANWSPKSISNRIQHFKILIAGRDIGSMKFKLTHIGELQGNDSEDFPETFSQKKYFAVL